MDYLTREQLKTVKHATGRATRFRTMCRVRLDSLEKIVVFPLHSPFLRGFVKWSMDEADEVVEEEVGAGIQD